MSAQPSWTPKPRELHVWRGHSLVYLQCAESEHFDSIAARAMHEHGVTTGWPRLYSEAAPWESGDWGPCPIYEGAPLSNFPGRYRFRLIVHRTPWEPSRPAPSEGTESAP